MLELSKSESPGPAASAGKCEFGKYEHLLNAHLAEFEFAIRRVFRKYASL